jgi:hypothetical protein
MIDPEPISVFDMPLDDAEEARLNAIADAEIDAGKGVPHEVLRILWVRHMSRRPTIP